MSFATWAAAATGATLALTSSAHCAAMCGPLALAARMRGGRSASVSYGVGRIVGYTAAGALAGAAGHALLASPLARYAELVLTALLVGMLLVAAAQHLTSGLTGGGAAARDLVQLGAAPKRSRAGWLLARVADEPLLLGVATALLPCGVLFLALTAAARLGTPVLGAVLLASFALVSGGVLHGASVLGARMLRTRATRGVLGALLLVAAGLTAYRALPLLTPAQAPSCPLHAQAEVR